MSSKDLIRKMDTNDLKGKVESIPAEIAELEVLSGRLLRKLERRMKLGEQVRRKLIRMDMLNDTKHGKCRKVSDCIEKSMNDTNRAVDSAAAKIGMLKIDLQEATEELNKRTYRYTIIHHIPGYKDEPVYYTNKYTCTGAVFFMHLDTQCVCLTGTVSVLENDEYYTSTGA